MSKGIDLVLKNGELCFVGPTMTDWSGENAGGLYLRDTRHLNYFTMSINETALERLDMQSLDPSSATVIDTNPRIRLKEGEDLMPRTISVEQYITLASSLSVRFVLRNFCGRAISVTCALEIAADFRDLFDIRGKARDRYGEYLTVQQEKTGVTLGYVGLDGQKVETEVRLDRLADVEVRDMKGGGTAHHASFDRMTGSAAPNPVRVSASFEVTMPANSAWELNVEITPRSAAEVSISQDSVERHSEALIIATTSTDNIDFNQVLLRSKNDLSMLHTCFPHGCMPAAGIPWYIAPFGRDSLIVGLQTFHVAPAAAASTLRMLAGFQGTKRDVVNDEAPGKIPHEMRYGEMARTGEIPHTPYFGSIDATPLFIMLFAELVAWTGDSDLFADLLPNVRQALDWIDEYGDLDGDGLVEYELTNPDDPDVFHPHPVWKDSVDSLHYIDGRSPTLGLIAPVEVQGYVFAAYKRLAGVLASMGEKQWAATLDTKAQIVQAKVEAGFWLEAEGFYAQALDDKKAPVSAISSNAGHLLYCGLPSPERVARMAIRFQQSDLDSGWGIRTLSSQMPSFNPMSYHNGSIWPHDNSLIIAGLHRYGRRGQANDIAHSLIRAAGTYRLCRIPELYCGFARDFEAAQNAPVPYPVSCSPQAWAAASVQMMIRSMLGCRIDIERGRLLVDPDFPEWLNEIVVEEMHVLGVTGSLSVRRGQDGYVVSANGPVVQARPNG